MESKEGTTSNHRPSKPPSSSLGRTDGGTEEHNSGPAGGDGPPRRLRNPSAAKEADIALHANYLRRQPHSRYIPSAEKWEAYLPAEYAFARHRSTLTAEYVDAWREDMLELEDMNNQLQDALRSQRKAHKGTQDKLTACQEQLSASQRDLLASQDEARELRLQLQREERARAADEEERRQHLEDRARRIAALTDELNAANARAAVSKQEASDLRGELDHAKAHVKELDREVSKLSRLHDCMHSDRAAAVLEQRAQTEEARREVERLKGEATSSADLARRVTELQTLLAAAQEEVRAEMRRGTAGAEEVGAARAAKAAAEHRAAQLHTALEEATEQRQQLKCDIARMQQEAQCEDKRTRQKLALGKLMLKLAQRKASALHEALDESRAEGQRQLNAAHQDAQQAQAKADTRAKALFKALRFTALRMKLSAAANGMRQAFDAWRVQSMRLHTVRRADVLPLLLQRKQRNNAWTKLCVALAAVVRNRQQRTALLRAWLRWRHVASADAAPVARAPAATPATPPPEPQASPQEVHHFHHFDDAVDVDEPRQQPVLCYGAVASDLPARSHSRPLQRQPQPHTAAQPVGQVKPNHVFYPTDERPQAAVRKPVARAAAVRQAARSSVHGAGKPATIGGRRHCQACEQLSRGQASSAQHSLRPGHCDATRTVRNTTAATEARKQATRTQLQHMQQHAQLQSRREHALADSQGQRLRQQAGTAWRSATHSPAAAAPHDTDEGSDISDFDTLSDGGEERYEAAQNSGFAQDFCSGAAESALPRPPQRTTATHAMASTLQFSRGTRTSSTDSCQASAGQELKPRVHWERTTTNETRTKTPSKRLARPEHCQRDAPAADQTQSSFHMRPPAAESNLSYSSQQSLASHPSSVPHEPPPQPQQPLHEDGNSTQEDGSAAPADAPSNRDEALEPSFETSMARIGRAYFESCAPLQVSSVHAIARLGAKEALLGVLSLADYLALGGQVGEARLSIPAPRDVGASAQADMFSLGVLQECLMGRSPGARGVWSTASAALLHGAATATGRAAPGTARGAENVLAGLGGEGLLKSTSAWNSIRSQVAILISRCEEYCLQGHLRRKWAIMWDALYQRLLMFVAWNVARSVEGFLFVAAAPLQAGAGRAAAQGGSSAAHTNVAANEEYGWKHGRAQSQPRPRALSPVATAAAGSRLAPPAWLRVGTQAVAEPTAESARYEKADSVLTAGSRGASTTADVLGSSWGAEEAVKGGAEPAMPATVPCLDPPLGNVLGGAKNGEAPSGSQRASLLYGRLASFVIAGSHGSSGDALRLLMVMQQLKTTFRRKAKQVDAVQAALGPEAAEHFLAGPFTGMPGGVEVDASAAHASACCPSAADMRFVLGEVVSMWQPQTDGHAPDPADSHKLDHLLLLQPDRQGRAGSQRGAVDTPTLQDGPTLQPVRFWQLVTHPIPCIQSVLGVEGRGAAASGAAGTLGAVAAHDAPEDKEHQRSVRHLLQQVHDASATAKPWRDVKMSVLSAVLPPLRASAGADGDAATDAGHAGPLQAALDAASTNKHARRLPDKQELASRSGHMLSDFSDLLAHLLDCMLLARAASTSLAAASAARAAGRTPTSTASPGFLRGSGGPSHGALDLAAGGRQRLVFDLHVAECILHLGLYVEFASWFSTQE